MPILRLIARGAYEPHHIEIMTQAFNEALRLANVTNRASVLAEVLAKRVIAEFQSGETNANRIAMRAACEERVSL